MDALHLEALLRDLPGALYRVRADAVRTAEFVSPGIEALTGFPAAAFLAGDLHWGELVHPDDAARVRAEVDAAVRLATHYVIEYRVRTAAGAERWVSDHGTGHPAAGAAGTLEGFVTDVTARHQAEQALARSESRFRDFALASGDWFWETDPEGRFTWFSDAVRRARGTEPASLIGLRRIDLAGAGADPAAEPWRSHLETLARREPFRDFRYRVPGPGPEIWVSSSGQPYHAPDGRFLGYRGSGRNITPEIEAQERANARLRDAIENLDEAVALTDAEDRILLANRRFRAMNGETVPVTPGRRYEDYIREVIATGAYPDAVGRTEAWMAARLARRIAGGTAQVQRADGRWLRITDQRLPDGGTITFSLDITEIKRAEEALRTANAGLERRVSERGEQLEASHRELDAFTYAVSHDLRAPLRAVSGFANILREEGAARLTADDLRCLARIDENASRMGELIDALLAVGRLSRQQTVPVRLNMTELARDTVAKLRPAYPAALVEVKDLPPAQADPELARQVLAILLGNALKFSRDATPPAVTVHAEAGAYAVSDNGVGFDMAWVARLFTPFSQLHAGDERGGPGVGLAIAKLIVERHGGRIEARSAPGQGATFRFTLGPEAAD